MPVSDKNLYYGPDALKTYFDPDSQPPLPMVELPAHLNPFYEDGVRIYAKMMTMHPANNVKAMPGMLACILLRVTQPWQALTSRSVEHAGDQRGAGQDQDHHRIQLGIHGDLNGDDSPGDARRAGRAGVPEQQDQ